MTVPMITPPFPLYSDIDGTALEDGYIWIGQRNLQPQTNPQAVYWDSAMTQLAAQPLRTINGFIANAGTPARIYQPSTAYSILVQDKKGSFVYQSLDVNANGGQSTIFLTSTQALCTSFTNADFVQTSSFFEGMTQDGARFFKNGNTGTPTTNTAAAIAAAIAANTFFNAAGVGYSLATDQDVYPEMLGFAGGPNETATILAAITFTAANAIKLHWKAATYNTRPVVVPSASHWVLNRGTIIKAVTGFVDGERLLSFEGMSNITIEGNGGVCQMLKSEYVSGDQRHCFYIYNCANVLITDITGKDAGGDGFYINGATDLTLINAVADNNRRNGCSLIKATRLRMLAPILKNNTGTAPQSGLVIEPNSPSDSLRDIVIESPQMIGNNGSGLIIFLDDYKTGTPEDVEITISNPVTRANAQYGYSVSNVYLNAGAYGGFIALSDPVSDSDGYNAFRIIDKSKDAPLLKISNPCAINPCVADLAYPNHSALFISDSSASASGGIHIDEISIKTTHAGMDYGIYMETGQGFPEDVRIGIKNIRGAVLNRVRWSNITSPTADASDALIDVSRLTGTIAITATSTNILGNHAGEIITNNGAVAGSSYFLREYMPPKNVYRFRVEAAQTVTIDVFDSLDRIVGTTAAGAAVTSNIIGAECQVYYIGTIGGVRYWKLDPIGPTANWTFT